MTRSILVGTGNRKKRDEMAALLADMDLRLVMPTELDPVPPPPEETGETFEANAASKALDYAAATGLWTIADDSGLVVDALDGAPGVRSARYSGEQATDEENNRKLLHALTHVPEAERGGGYVSVVTLAAPGRVLLSTRGTCRGRILTQPRGAGGFGYDPLFFVDELGRTFAEITAAEKARLSHRGEALRQLKLELPAILHDAQTAS